MTLAMTAQTDQYADSETLTLELELPEFPAPMPVPAAVLAPAPTVVAPTAPAPISPGSISVGAAAPGPKGVDRSAILAQVMQALATAVTPEDMIRNLFDDTKQAFGIDAYFNFMINDRGDALKLVSYEGIAHVDAGKIERLEFGRGIGGNVALKRAPIVVSDVQRSDDPRVHQVKGFGIRSYACMPLVADDHLLGTLSFASRTRERFSDLELELFNEIARNVALAYMRLRRSGQRRESDRRQHEFLTTLMQELRDPAAPIRAALDVVRARGEADSDLQSACSTIEQQLTGKLRALADLLEVAPIEEVQAAAEVQLAVEDHSAAPVTPVAEVALAVEVAAAVEAIPTVGMESAVEVISAADMEPTVEVKLSEGKPSMPSKSFDADDEEHLTFTYIPAG